VGWDVKEQEKQMEEWKCAFTESEGCDTCGFGMESWSSDMEMPNLRYLSDIQGR
jgi:hypothetical protein